MLPPIFIFLLAAHAGPLSPIDTSAVKLCDLSGPAHRAHRAVVGLRGRRPLEASDTSVSPALGEDAAFGAPDCILVAYERAFLQLFGAAPSWTLLSQSHAALFHEAAIALPQQGAVLVTSNRLKAKPGGQQHVQISRVSLSTGEVTPLSPSPSLPMANGGAAWRDGRVLLAMQGQGERGGALVALDPNTQAAEILADNFHGLPFNSLNDVAVSPVDGSLYITDPPYGYPQNFRAAPSFPPMVWRVDPNSREIRAVLEGLQRPNGVAFSPDGAQLYITDSGFYPGDGTQDATASRGIYRFGVDYAEGGVLTDKRLFAFVDAGVPDGIKVDSQGNVWVGCGDGVHVFSKSGALLGKIHPPGGGGITNLTWLGDRLVLLAEDKLYAVQPLAKL